MMKPQNFFKYSSLALLAFGVSVPVTYAEDLKSVFQQTLHKAPQILEAQANVQAADARIEQARSMHYPTFGIDMDRYGAEWHRDRDDYADHKFEPHLNVRMNVYSFGAIQSNVEKSKAEKSYYQQKFAETREDLLYQAGQIYLDGLLAKNTMAVLQKSLKRHQTLMQEIKGITRLDKGRRSEYVQVQARTILVEQKINEQQRILNTDLNRLRKFTRRSLSVADLVSPFVGVTKDSLKNQYQLSSYRFHPTFKTGNADLATKDADYQAQRYKGLPTIDLVGRIGREDRSVMVQFRWDLYNRQNNYDVQEKASLKAAASQSLDQISLNLQEMAEQSLINLNSANRELAIIERQIAASRKVADFNRLQFQVGRKSLLDVLSGENELSDMRVAYVNAQYRRNQAILDYLHAQGALVKFTQQK